LVERRGLADRAAGLVHEGLGLEDENALGVEHAFADLALEAPARSGEAMAADDGIHRHEADIVPVPGVFRAGVAEAGKQDHRMSPGRECARPYSSAASSTSPSSSSPSAASPFRPAGAAMVATVKSRSVIAGVTP